MDLIVFMTHFGVVDLIVSMTHFSEASTLGVVTDSIVSMTHSGVAVSEVSILGADLTLGVILMALILLRSTTEDLETIFS